jgi:hypothetical protein
VDETLRLAAENAKGFMPADEGLALHGAGLTAGREHPGVPFVEVGSYCGKSSIYLGAAARDTGTVLVTIDHHRGSEEMQLGWDHHDGEVTDAGSGRMDSLPQFRRTIAEADLEEVVVGVIGNSETVGRLWTTPASLVFIDGGHGPVPAHADYELWAPHVVVGGLLAIHDVFPDPAEGGRPPFEIFRRAIDSGDFVEHQQCGSLRVLRRTN